MKRTNTQHIDSKKKTYRKPVLEVVEVDRDLVLMQTTSTEPPSGTSTFNDNQTTHQQEKMFPESQDPFGGDSPNYER